VILQWNRQAGRRYPQTSVVSTGFLTSSRGGIYTPPPPTPVPAPAPRLTAAARRWGTDDFPGPDDEQGVWPVRRYWK
jgi:hypothetical protein